MEGLGLSGYIGVSQEAINGAKIPKITSKTFGKFIDVYATMPKLSDEELDEVVADCRNGKWNKKLPGKPWYFCLLSKKKRKEQYLYIIEFIASMKKFDRKAYNDAINDPEKIKKIRDIVFERDHHGCDEEIKENAREGDK